MAGRPVGLTYEFSYAEMNVLFDLIEDARKARKDDPRLEELTALRNELQRRLS